MDVIHLLQVYGEKENHIGCKLALKWIQSEGEHSKERAQRALHDSLVQSLYKEAQLGISCGVRPVYTPKPTSILGYFASSGPSPPSHVSTSTLSVSPPTAAPSAAAPTASEEQVALFSDGACSNNGKKSAKAGFGVTVGLVSKTGYREMAQVTEPLQPSESQTNQRAELRGLSKAWNIATMQLPAVLQRMGKYTTKVHIYTDSQYSLDCILKWALTWSKKGWAKADGTPVLHRDIIEPLFTAVKEWKQTPYAIEFHHINSHTGKTDPFSIGNARADELATSSISY